MAKFEEKSVNLCVKDRTLRNNRKEKEVISMAYYGYTDSRKRANEKYLAKLAEIRLRMTPEEKKEIERMALLEGKSVNQFVKDKIFGVDE